jgi:hypothetical protein
MKAVNKIKNIQPKVQKLLKEKSILRDDDAKLIARFWLDEMGGVEKASSINGLDLLKMIASGALTNTESIVRARRKIQSESDELKGIKYRARKQEAQLLKQFINA